MNCKQGDLAIVIKSVAGNEGKIVRCTKYVGQKNFAISGYKDAWETDPVLIGHRGNPTFGMDDCLRPIRDPGEDAVDEVIQRLGSPNKQEQKA